MGCPCYKNEKLRHQALLHPSLFQTEEAYQIFLHPEKPILKTEDLKLRVAKKLEAHGFFHLMEEHTVLCVDPDDYWDTSAPDPECQEILKVSKNPLPYSEEDPIICSRCGHEFFLSESRKKITSFYRLQPQKKVLLELFEDRLTEQNLIWHRLEEGKYCIIQGSSPVVFFITDYSTYSSTDPHGIPFRFLVSYTFSKTFPLADFLCARKQFQDVLAPQKEVQQGTQPLLIQLILSSDLITLGGVRLISIQAEKQWKLFQMFLAHPDETLSLKHMTEEWEKQGDFITDPEQQIRRPLNKIRERTESLGYSKNTLISSTTDGYCFHSKAFPTLSLV
ncbi:hypothetical protein AGMMS49949_06510 [Alphaproteobacteria bacterium]|nr:hypothetical protein AGMMS49949_06510 [Alphaproteobacteria bacterium]GHS98373.1 hypothetical protein AGMMS50296_5990 [Alphaproteobacteria bacterium]